MTTTLAIAIFVFFFTMMFDGIEFGDQAAPNSIRPTDAGSNSVVLSFANAGSSAAGDSELVLLVDLNPESETCSLDATLMISRVNLEAVAADEMHASDSAPAERGGVVQSTSPTLSGTDGMDLVFFTQQKMQSKLVVTYRSIFRLAAIMGLPRIQNEAVLLRTTFIGAISTYNPYREGKEEGSMRTASGELYDPAAWTAAVQTSLRNQFGGIRHGRLYQPAYALVASGEKRVIVKINDVGPLKSGRVLDLNERSMRYFDPFLAKGLIQNAKITLLPGEDWVAGPVGAAYTIDFAAAGRERAGDSANEQTELTTMRRKFDHAPFWGMKAGARVEARLNGG